MMDQAAPMSRAAIVKRLLQTVDDEAGRGRPAKARLLGKISQSVTFTDVTLSSGVRPVSKATDLWVSPWPARPGSVPLRTATWWARRRYRARPHGPGSSAGGRVSGRPDQSRSRRPAHGRKNRSASASGRPREIGV